MKRKLRKMMWLMLAVLLLTGSMGMVCLGAEDGAAEGEEEQWVEVLLNLKYQDSANEETRFSTTGNNYSTKEIFLSIDAPKETVTVENLVNEQTLKVTAKRGNYLFQGWRYCFIKNDLSTEEVTGDKTFNSKSGYLMLICEPIWAGSIDYIVNYPESGAQGPTTVNWSVTAEDNTEIQISHVADTGEYIFTGWNDGDTLYACGASYTVTKDKVTMIGTWKPANHQVIYDGNGAVSGVPEIQNAGYSTKVTVSGTPARNGYRFLGWEQADGTVLQAGDTFTMPASDVTLKAKWEIAQSGISKGGTFYLVRGQGYRMEKVMKVKGDTSDYQPGITFYVSEDREYIFE